MPDNKHTPEPWEVRERGDYGQGPEADLSVEMDNAMRGYLKLADARRIISCVNACAGMTNEQLDNICMISGSILSRFGEQMHYLGQVEKQRDELLAALNRLYVACPTTIDCQHFHHSKREQHSYLEPCGPAGEYLAAIEQSRAAIASVKGEQ